MQREREGGVSSYTLVAELRVEGRARGFVQTQLGTSTSSSSSLPPALGVPTNSHESSMRISVGVTSELGWAGKLTTWNPSVVMPDTLSLAARGLPCRKSVPRNEVGGVVCCHFSLG